MLATHLIFSLSVFPKKYLKNHLNTVTWPNSGITIKCYPFLKPGMMS
jgi:hypothetical protein